ncbi:MAG: hypothetical protein J1E28_07660 [Helicobacter sp.]|uniref:3-oxoacyl-[acyl-carrier-protein] synthase III C-terminal domain-containing protein n=1 Tax=Helicobacter sp. TaxID=218 RepID=UPI0025C46D27|nr:3-oxoacyl-[acyl-carrier-protein] synthase III C-terminal domain-containing protein [Helicobacter sp.]MCH5314245.1 hypothetical protein [Helicobacter sp.]
MATSIIKNMRIAGISVVLGEHKKHFKDEPLWWNNEKHCKKLQSTIGFDITYVANKDTTTLNLCEAASLNIIKALGIEVSSINAIVSITQTPDYPIPGNAHILHKNLGLNKECIALDMEFACSGYVYGLFVAGMLVNAGIKRVLLVVGDTLSKYVNKKDKTTAPLFSDTGSATIIDFDTNATDSYFILKSDGNGWEQIYKKAGACKMPSSEFTRIESSDENGNIRSAENLYMNGIEVFNFTLTEQPSLLEETLDFAHLTKNDIDYFVLHQANTYIVESILKKAGIPFEKAPRIFSKYGNQNAVSIPTTICEELRDKLDKKKKVLMQGFGGGLSWGACIADLENVLCLKPQIYKGGYVDE